MSTLVTIAAYAAAHGKSVRQVQRYVREGRLPGVVELDGVTHIPVDVLPPRRADVVATSPTSPAVPVAPAPGISPLGALGTLEDAARLLGTDVGGVRAMARDGLLTIGRYGPGPGKPYRVYVAPR